MKEFTVIAIIALALVSSYSVSAQHHHRNVILANTQVKFTVVDEAVSIANYTDDTLEPTGWILYPSV